MYGKVASPLAVGAGHRVHGRRCVSSLGVTKRTCGWYSAEGNATASGAPDPPRGLVRPAGQDRPAIQHGDDEAGVAGPVVPRRRGGGQKRHHPPLAETPLDHQRDAVAQPGEHAGPPSRPAAASSARPAKYRSTSTVPRKLLRLSAKTRKMKWLASDLHVGGLLQAIDQQLGRPGQRQGKQPLAVAIERVVDEVGCRTARRGRRPRRRRSRTYCSRASTAEWSSRSTLARLIAWNSPQRLGGQERRHFDLRLQTRAHLSARRKSRIQIAGVGRRRIAVDQQHRHLGGQIDHGVAGIVGLDGVALQPGGDEVLAGRGES